MSLIDRARMLRPIIQSLAANLDDETALAAIQLFQKWQTNKEYQKDEKVRYNDILYKVNQTHTSQDDWTPDIATSLFSRVLIPDSEQIPVWEQPDSTNGYMIGDKVHYPTIEDSVYESTIDNNVWSPVSYPQGWKLVEE